MGESVVANFLLGFGEIAVRLCAFRPERAEGKKGRRMRSGAERCFLATLGAWRLPLGVDAYVAPDLWERVPAARRTYMISSAARCVAVDPRRGRVSEWARHREGPDGTKLSRFGPSPTGSEVQSGSQQSRTGSEQWRRCNQTISEESVGTGNQPRDEQEQRPSEKEGPASAHQPQSPLALPCPRATGGSDLTVRDPRRHRPT